MTGPRVLHFASSDSAGGAAKAASRLHVALRAQGVESVMVVQNRVLGGLGVVSFPGHRSGVLRRLRGIVDYLPLKLYPRRNRSAFFSPAWLPNWKLTEVVRHFKPDLIHIHWVQGGFLSLETFRDLRVPYLVTMHDNWLYTGGCHVSWSCERYNLGCGRCPQLESRFTLDLSRLGYLRKKATLRLNPPRCIIGVSSWIADKARESRLLKCFPTAVVPNPLDTSVFSPSRGRLNADETKGTPKKVILFGGTNATSDPNKGFALLQDALSLVDRSTFRLLIFGTLPHTDLSALAGFEVEDFGSVLHETELARLYGSADVMVVPSRQESFGQTASEALACGTPVVCFDHSGLKDIVDHLVNGYRAKPFDASDLARGINWVLDHPDRDSLARAARAKAVEAFGLEPVARRAMSLYQKCLQGSGSNG